jgi:hypothetical protein
MDVPATENPYPNVSFTMVTHSSPYNPGPTPDYLKPQYTVTSSSLAPTMNDNQTSDFQPSSSLVSKSDMRKTRSKKGTGNYVPDLPKPDEDILPKS